MLILRGCRANILVGASALAALVATAYGLGAWANPRADHGDRTAFGFFLLSILGFALGLSYVVGFLIRETV